MWRLFFCLLVLALATLVLAQLADRPGEVAVTWLGYDIETSIYVAALAVVLLLGLLIGLVAGLRYLLTRPRAIKRYLAERNEARGREALTRGMIAAEIGDGDVAGRSAATARRALPADPLTALLGVKAARLAGDRATMRALLEDMTGSPETKLAGLHGLYLEARREDELEAARQFAERALEANPRLAWSGKALLDLQARAADWQGALDTLAKTERAGHVEKQEARRKRAVLLTAQAMALEEGERERAQELALEAHKLAPDLVPAAALASRLLAAGGNAHRAGRVISRTWALSPHPDLATAYAYLRMGDSPRERLNRVRELAQSAEGGTEGAVAVASAAAEARDWQAARAALAPLLDRKPTARVFTLMARIEEGERGDAGRVREWLGRALRAPRDPAWMADAVVFKAWAPVSPASGVLDAFVWQAPAEALESAETPIIEGRGEAEDEEAAGPLPEPLDLAGMETAPEAGEQGAAEEGGAPDEAGEAAEEAKEERAGEADAGGEAPAEEAAGTVAEPVLPRPPDDPGEASWFEEEEEREVAEPVPGPPPESSG